MSSVFLRLWFVKPRPCSLCSGELCGYPKSRIRVAREWLAPRLGVSEHTVSVFFGICIGMVIEIVVLT